MGIETKEKEIGGLRFSVEQFAVFRSQRLLMKLLKLAGGPLLSFAVAAGITDARTALGVFGNLKIEELGGMLEGLFSKLDPETMEELTKEILASTSVFHADKFILLANGGPKGRGVADAVIGGDIMTFLLVQAFALSVHFGNFSGARDALAGLGLKIPSPSQGSSTSTDGTPES